MYKNRQTWNEIDGKWRAEKSEIKKVYIIRRKCHLYEIIVAAFIVPFLLRILILRLDNKRDEIEEHTHDVAYWLAHERK